MEYNEYQQEGALGWDDEIRKESEFILLEPGDYDFMVESMERARFEGSQKMTACNCADLNLRVETSKGSVIVHHRLFLHQKAEWALSAFFRCIGQKKKDEPIKMNWNLVPGARGRCKVGRKKYNDNEYNEIKKFYPADEATVQQTYTPPRSW